MSLPLKKTWSLLNVRVMPNRCCDKLDKKQPDSELERVTLGLRYIQTADPLWNLPIIPNQVETQLSLSPLRYSQCQFQV